MPRKPESQIVLVFQGGGALGAYQGEVYEQLAAHGFQADWVVGTSIGAINAALIAGNPPERRLQPWLNAGGRFDTVTRGVPGFFVPRRNGLLNIDQPVPTQDASFYDTSPLLATLEELVDFDHLNEGPVRCTVCAVEVASGELKVFDSRKERLSALHIMASGPSGLSAHHDQGPGLLGR